MTPERFRFLRDSAETWTMERINAAPGAFLNEALDALKQAACASLSTECHDCRQPRGHEGPCR